MLLIRGAQDASRGEVLRPCGALVKDGSPGKAQDPSLLFVEWHGVGERLCFSQTVGSHFTTARSRN